MTERPREKFATKVDAEILRSVRNLACAEGRRIQTLVEEALTDLIEKRKQARPRAHVMAAYNAGQDEFTPLYRKLAD